MDDGRKRRWFHRRTDQAAGSAPIRLADRGPLADSTGPADPTGSPAAPTRHEPTEQQLAEMIARLTDYVHVQVRSGIYALPQLRELTLQAAAAESEDPDRADEMARRVLSSELQGWREDAERWGTRTDCDRLDRALDRIDQDGILVRAGLLDSESLAESIRVRGVDNGLVTYLVSDIWRAIDTNSLRLTVIDSDGTPAGRRSALVRQVVAALGDCGLLAGAGTAGGHVDVAMIWRRHPPR